MTFNLLKTVTGLSLIFILLPYSSYAKRIMKDVNYYASLRSNKTNVRTGPGRDYPVKFTFKARGIPLRVISEYDNWSEIRDYEGQSGWIIKTLLTKRRTLMVRTTQDYVSMYSKNNTKSKVILHLENNVIGSYIKCLDEWCKIKIDNQRGWVEKSNLYGYGA